MFTCNIDSDDIAAIRQIAFQTWPVAYGHIISSEQMDYMLAMMYSLESLRHQIEKQHHRFIIAYDKDNNAIGFASFSLYKNQNNHHRLHKLYVLPGIQQQGVGKSLLEIIFIEIRRNGMGILELNVNRNNSAVKFYQKLGFDISREEDIDIGNGFFMNDYVMTRIVQ